MKCKHQWEEIERTVARPQIRNFSVEGIGAAGIIEKYRAGTTHFLLRCKECGDYQTKESLGVFEEKQSVRCEHDWQDARNEVVQSGEYCTKCFSVRPGNNCA